MQTQFKVPKVLELSRNTLITSPYKPLSKKGPTYQASNLLTE